MWQFINYVRKYVGLLSLALATIAKNQMKD